MKRFSSFLFAFFTVVANVVERFLTVLVVKIVRFYQIAISPLFGPCCRFTPTC
ncbi:MAG: membrane protein insertion efficiency factor YidD, partial [Thermoguttaceae bacterium]|nr:membrane protein insertion efficiency factor YidD [Thermoguttaceae bacterium]